MTDLSVDEFWLKYEPHCADGSVLAEMLYKLAKELEIERDDACNLASNLEYELELNSRLDRRGVSVEPDKIALLLYMSGSACFFFGSLILWLK